MSTQQLKTSPQKFVSNETNFTKTVRKLKLLNGTVRQGETAKGTIIKVVEDFVRSLPYGDKDRTRNRLIDEADISRASFYRWKKELEDAEEERQIIPAERHEEFSKLKRPVREKVLQEYRENPKTDFKAILTKVSRENGQSTRTVNPADALSSALTRYLEATDDVEGLLDLLEKQSIPREKICTALRKRCSQ